MNKRFKEVRTLKGLTQRKYGEILGLSQNHVSGLERGDRCITDRIIRDLNINLNVNEEWVRYGIGNMFNEGCSISTKFINRLKAYRSSLNLNKSDLSKELNVDEIYYNSIEYGTKKPSKEFLSKLVLHSSKSEEYWLYGVVHKPKSLDIFQLNFSKKLKDFRLNQCLTQVEFAEKYKLPRTTITELENGSKNPTINMIKKISTATDTDLSYWVDSCNGDSNFKYLNSIILKLINKGMIDKDANISDKAKEILINAIQVELKCSYLK